MTEFAWYVWSQLHSVIDSVLLPLPYFIILAVAINGPRPFRDIRASAAEIRIALLMLTTDAFLVAPILVVLATAMGVAFDRYGLTLVAPSLWDAVPPVLVAFFGLFIGDLVGYWRHRIEHTAILWPAHAVHHSDTAMTWFAIFRFHPINRLTTFTMDAAVLMAFGFPPYVAIFNGLVRHYYGAFIHADLPWTYGNRAGRTLVSPVMHRWHHALDPAAFNSNFAVIFAFIDVIFGTYRVPGPCNVPLGVSDTMAPGFAGQMLHPFKPTSYAAFRALARRRSAKAKD